MGLGHVLDARRGFGGANVGIAAVAVATLPRQLLSAFRPSCYSMPAIAQELVAYTLVGCRVLPLVRA